MSAFLVSDEHIQFLADVLAEVAGNKHHIFNHSVCYMMDKLGFDLYQASISECEAAAIAVANRLYEINELALKGRYGDEPQERRPVTRIKYTAIHANKYQQYKAFTCLRYQCSEDIADETMTYKWLTDLVGRMAEAIVLHAPEYDRAAWEIREPIGMGV